MNRVCAWCNKLIGIIEPVQDRRVTHGCCPECEEKQLDEDAKEATK